MDLAIKLLLTLMIVLIINKSIDWVIAQTFYKNFMRERRAKKLGITVEEVKQAEEELERIEKELDRKMRIL